MASSGNNQSDTDNLLASFALEKLRAEKIELLEAAGQLDPACKMCQEHFYPYYLDKWEPGMGGPFVPRHKASDRCRSNKYNHCTCDVCF